MARTGSNGVEPGGIVTGASTVLLIAAACLGWITASFAGASSAWTGIDLFDEASPGFNGIVTILLGLGATGLTLLAPEDDGASLGAALLGGLITLVGLAFLFAPSTALGGGFGGSVAAGLSSAGIGVFLTVLGGLGVVAGGMLNYASS